MNFGVTSTKSQLSWKVLVSKALRPEFLQSLRSYKIFPGQISRFQKFRRNPSRIQGVERWAFILVGALLYVAKTDCGSDFVF